MQFSSGFEAIALIRNLHIEDPWILEGRRIACLTGTLQSSSVEFSTRVCVRTGTVEIRYTGEIPSQAWTPKLCRRWSTFNSKPFKLACLRKTVRRTYLVYFLLPSLKYLSGLLEACSAIDGCIRCILLLNSLRNASTVCIVPQARGRLCFLQHPKPDIYVGEPASTRRA